MGGAPRLLLVTTTWWPSLAILASALEQAGFAVCMVCPTGHAAFAARRFACRELDRRAPMESLVAAIEAVAPTLIVAGDERVVRALRGLHAELPHLRTLIERSIGHPDCHALLSARVPLLEAAPAAGFSTPETQVLASEHDLEAWMVRVPTPWVLKIDDAWGGEGVRVSSQKAECRRMFRALRKGIPLSLAWRRRFIGGDPFPWRDRMECRDQVVSAQAFVAGRPGNCAAFALGGRLLGATVVEATVTCRSNGPSLLVQAVDRPPVVDNVARLIAERKLSGFLGFDFIIDGNDRANLIEMNPRITMPCRIQGPFGPSPVNAAAQALGAMRQASVTTPARTRFASFPLAWLEDPYAPELTACSADVPWHEPELMRDSLRPLWPERGPLARLPSRLRGLRDRLRGRARPDYRDRPFSWWVEQGILNPNDLSRRNAGSEEPAADGDRRTRPDLEQTGADGKILWAHRGEM